MLKKCFGHMSLDVGRVVCHTAIPPAQIVESIRGKEFLGDDIPTPVYTNVKHTMAKEIINNDLISYSAKLGVFTIRSDTAGTVTLAPEICSCPARHDCIHILAVKLSLGLGDSEDKLTLKKQNLATLRKNARLGRAKPGRKKPRTVDVEVIPAPDSHEGKKSAPLDDLFDDLDIDDDVDDEKKVVVPDKKVVKRVLDHKKVVVVDQPCPLPSLPLPPPSPSLSPPPSPPTPSPPQAPVPPYSWATVLPPGIKIEIPTSRYKSRPSPNSQY